jgi:RNA polymerase sigma-70 factor (ECF subfamily)
MNSQKHHKTEFSKLIQKNQAIIHKVTLIYANSVVEREDLFQEICLQLWRSYSNFRKESQFSTWMYRVALNTAISTIRKNTKSPDFEPLKESVLTAAETSENADNVAMLYAAISKLNGIDKALILLWLEEKSYDEIASVLGITKTNVSVKLVRIKRKLEEMIIQAVKQES